MESTPINQGRTSFDKEEEPNQINSKSTDEESF